MQARSLVTVMVCLALLLGSARAGDIRITLPKRSKPTPVQKLNRDGVKALEKNDIEKAKKLFYRAYLLDPNDPFTLNNLGYIAELAGDVERAERFYSLAGSLESDAHVDLATSESAEGRNVTEVAGSAEQGSLQVNRLNVNALSLLLRDRAPEADLILQKALALDPKNPFTLNNMGFAKEKQGELEQALSFYSAAANVRSDDKVIVSVNKSWRGQAISEVAEQNAREVRRALRREEDVETRVARMNLRGVSALNRNERRLARQYFGQAYRLAPDDAFTINNMGYVAELDGDRETAEYFYAKAREAERADARVTVATRREAEGQRVEQVAEQSGGQVEARMRAEAEARRRHGEPIELKRRDAPPQVNQPPAEPNQTPPKVPDWVAPPTTPPNPQ
jgi:Flp pilus assembly protein TadD